MTEERRKEIVRILKSREKPIVGSELAKRFNVSRQVIVQDIAVLRARGLNIISTSNGYFIAEAKDEGKNIVTVVCSHFGYDAMMKELSIMIEMGAKVIGCSEQGHSIQGLELPIYEEKPIFTDEEWNRLIKGYNRLAELAEEKGMKVSLHHHMGTGIQTPEEIDRFMESTEDNVYLLFDTGHIYFSEGKQEAVDNLIDKYIDRIVHIHLKDVRREVLERVKAERWSFLKSVREGVFTVPGDGIINFDHVFDVIGKSGFEGWLVVEAEQDPAIANPFEYAIKARKFIREKTGL